ncbi:hypothetical protein [Mangrovibrevibacter kandeliae]|uniref:hypothetical protein n=1 Tax=Mangrovibrevibacter kandeliae TaxID=2968473 RepID=UPI0021173CCB|nr:MULTISPECIES: hypothetical protein [unclassified Aurantimonas]MCQ8781560.1 hypothetical protein [Aurantimonas sp. CSK15Z-1]MCW4114334.1 hypothetical protein [Aurantimonas sp. MSK8Z-1]
MLDTAPLPRCHASRRYRLENVLRRERRVSEVGIALMKSAMSAPGESLTLDIVIQILANACPAPYDVVSRAVRQGLFVVEFEPEALPFPFRDILVRRL